MLDFTLLSALAGFAFVSSITPGPNNLMLMASGTNFGFARTIPHMLGVSVGFTLMVVLVGFGVAGAFTAFPVLGTALKVVSVAYLLYLAWKIATSPPPESEGLASRSRPMTFIQAALFQWVNPKAWSMALTAVTAYAPAGDPLIALAVVAIVFGAINLPSVGLWAAMGVQLRRVMKNVGAFRAFNIIAALLLVATLYPVVFADQAV